MLIFKASILHGCDLDSAREMLANHCFCEKSSALQRHEVEVNQIKINEVAKINEAAKVNEAENIKNA